jgi:hypothetical protein
MPGPLDPSLRLSADLLTGQGLQDDALPAAHWRMGTVTSVGTGTAAVTIGGVSLPAVRFVEGIIPAVGQLVVVLVQGPDHFIVGTRSTTSTPLTGGTVVPACRRSRNTVATAGTSGSFTSALGWNILDFDTDGMSTSFTTTIEINTNGLYRVAFGGAWAINTTGRRIFSVFLNNAEWHRQELPAATATGGITVHNSSRVADLTSSDTLDLRIFQTSGGSLDTRVDTYQLPFLEAVWLGTTS